MNTLNVLVAGVVRGALDTPLRPSSLLRAPVAVGAYGIASAALLGCKLLDA